MTVADADEAAGGLRNDPSPITGFLPAVAVFAVLMVGYQLLLGPTLSPATYSENDSQSSLINIQASLYGEPSEVAVVGSSISARLLDSFFAEQGVDVMGLGLNAQGPALGIDLLADADRIPDVVAMELNRSLYSSSGNEETINSKVDSPSFRVAERVPLLKAESRPTSLVYTELKNLKDGAGAPETDSSLAPLVWSTDEDPAFDPSVLTDEQRAGVDRVLDALDDATASGACIILFLVPDKGFAGPAEQAFAEHLSFEYGAPVVDLRALENQTELVYTDNIHLDTASARIVSHQLAEELATFRQERRCGAGSAGRP